MPGIDSWLVTQPLAQEALPRNKFEVIQADFGHVTNDFSIIEIQILKNVKEKKKKLCLYPGSFSLRYGCPRL